MSTLQEINIFFRDEKRIYLTVTSVFARASIKSYCHPTKFRPRKSCGLEMSIWKFPRTYLRAVPLTVKRGVVFRKALRYSFELTEACFFIVLVLLGRQ